MDNKNILNFIFELGMLMRLKNEGLKLAGIKDTPSLSEHALRASQIGFILAKLEKYENPFEVCTMIVFHNIDSCRIGDIHRVANRYVNVKEENVVKEQTENLENIGKEIFQLWKQVEERSTKSGIISRDAAMLEHAFTAKEHIEKGYKHAQNWIDNVSKGLKTESAKKLLNDLTKSDSNEWWQGLKKLKYEPPNKK